MSTDAELSQLRGQLAEMQRERDYWQAENGRLRNELGQMHEKQVDLREKAGIIEQKYTASKVRAVEARRRIEAAECARARVIRLRSSFATGAEPHAAVGHSADGRARVPGPLGSWRLPYHPSRKLDARRQYCPRRDH